MDAQTALLSLDTPVGGTPTGPWYEPDSAEAAFITLAGLLPMAEVVGDPPQFVPQDDEPPDATASDTRSGERGGSRPPVRRRLLAAVVREPTAFRAPRPARPEPRTDLAGGARPRLGRACAPRPPTFAQNSPLAA